VISRFGSYTHITTRILPGTFGYAITEQYASLTEKLKEG